jgi:hypothetical protein
VARVWRCKRLWRRPSPSKQSTCRQPFNACLLVDVSIVFIYIQCHQLMNFCVWWISIELNLPFRVILKTETGCDWDWMVFSNFLSKFIFNCLFCCLFCLSFASAGGSPVSSGESPEA